MHSIPQYLIESSFCLLAFYSFYHFVLKQETFFQLNRFYLLLTPMLSLLIPYWNISFQQEASYPAFNTVLYPAISSAQNVQADMWAQLTTPTPVFSLSVADLVLLTYLIGAIFMASILMVSLWRLSRLIKNGQQQKQDGFTKVELSSNFPAASFFGYLFWNKEITDEQKLILEHEKVHIRQWHSLDILLMELLVIIKWFNPLIYFFRNALRVTHEFIADQFVIQHKTNIKTYANLLVTTSKLQPAPLTNTFYSMTAKRLKMMLQQPSKKWKKAKFLLILPMTMCLMALFSFNQLAEITPLQEGLQEMDLALSDLGNKTIFEIDLEQDKGASKQSNNTYEIRWGQYTFACVEKMRNERQVCDCEEKYVRQADLKGMNKKGIRFYKNKKAVDFYNVQVTAEEFVYCEQEDLMLSSDMQETYDKKACIWNAFEEENDLGWVSFQTEEFARVHFTFGINSTKANQIIPAYQLVMPTKTVRLGRGSSKSTLSFEAALSLLDEANYIQYYGQKVRIDTVKFEAPFGGGSLKYYYLTNPEDIASLKDLISDKTNFFPYSKVNKERNSANLTLFTLNDKQEIEHPIPSFSWNQHTFNYKKPYLQLSKKELLDVVQDYPILAPNKEELKIENIEFVFRVRPNVTCDFQGTWEELQKMPCFKEHLNYLQHGDILHFPGLKLYWSNEHEHAHTSTHLSVLIEEPARKGKEEILIMESDEVSQQVYPTQLKTDGTHWQIQNISFENLIKKIKNSRPRTLKIVGENLPNLDVFFHSPKSNVSEEMMYEQILERLHWQYDFTIKTIEQEETAWYLSGGNKEKIQAFTEEAKKPNLEFFNEQVIKKGLESVGPMEFEWFADRYFELTHNIKVRDLTGITGRYILPLQTKDLKSLQKQLKKDYGLILSQESKTVPMTVVHFK